MKSLDVLGGTASACGCNTTGCLGLSPDLDVVQKAKGPIMTALNAKYKETSEGGLAVSVVLC